MPKNLFLLLFAFAWPSFYAHAQPGATIQACVNGACMSICPTEYTFDYNAGYNTGSGGSLRYGYIKLTPGAEAFIVQFNTALIRWEIYITDFEESQALFYSTAASIPNPPNLAFGNWVNANVYCQPSNLVLGVFEGTGTQSTLALPIELASFDAQLIEGHKNLLTWATASETNNAGFDIEAAPDGIRFEKIGFVKGNGTTTDRQAYRFLDENAADGSTFYRLKQVDFDGGFDYSNIVSVLRKSERLSVVSVLPNPAADILQVAFQSDTDTAAQLRLSDAQGRIVLERSVLFKKGDNTLPLDLSGLPAGMYFLQITDNGQVHSARVLKE